MEALSAGISAHDVMPGIWFRPLQSRDESLPEKCRLSFDADCLDPSVPETLDYIAQDLSLIHI